MSMQQLQKERTLLLTGEPVTSLAQYRALGGLEAYEQVRQMDPDEVIELLRVAGLRGRGGAGFPTALKWKGLREAEAARKFVCCNGAEGEPGTFKDRYLLRHNPYQTLEGLAIAAHIIGAEAAFFCVKEIFKPMLHGLTTALAELQAETDMADNIEIVWGPDEYLFGEEKALCSVVEGGLPLPRVLPPYMHGVFTGAYGGPDGNPTDVNNVETLSHVPHIISQGPGWFRSYGNADTPGTMIFTVMGDVRHPVVRELPLGGTLRELIDDVAGGALPGREVKAVFPGLANAVITAGQLDSVLGFDSMRNAGSALGSGGYIVYDDTACMVKVAERFVHFLHIESCNQCPPCKIGSRKIMRWLEQLLAGDAVEHDVEEMMEVATWVTNGGRCYLPTSTSLVTSSILGSFPEDFQAHLEGRCELRHDIEIPKIKDYDEDYGFTLDHDYDRKQPDWSYI
ncbi:MAG TPA: NADH-ubiquinone oxidoreductase-F iron-sulfur binding region domain-containing protein [Dehalococcoidia bacterium]|jgi:NADH:ubiquinone oxidoreductase subunit F (NADH-binding)